MNIQKFVCRSVGLVGFSTLFLFCPHGIHAQMIIAHRGASHDAPENTLAAFNLAWKQGADGIEGDFRLTRDNKIVCIHDSDTKRTAGTKLEVSRSSLAELRRLDVGAWKDSQFSGEQVPTLAEVLSGVPKDKTIYIEVKCGPEILPFLRDTVEGSSVGWDQVVVISFKSEVIAGLKKLLPKVKAYWLTGFDRKEGQSGWAPTIEEIARTIAETKADGLSCQGNLEVLTGDFASQLSMWGIELHCWTVDDPADAKYFSELGVGSITTNRPATLIQHLRRSNFKDRSR